MRFSILVSHRPDRKSPDADARNTWKRLRFRWKMHVIIMESYSFLLKPEKRRFSYQFSAPIYQYLDMHAMQCNSSRCQIKN